MLSCRHVLASFSKQQQSIPNEIVHHNSPNCKHNLLSATTSKNLKIINNVHQWPLEFSYNKLNPYIQLQLFCKTHVVCSTKPQRVCRNLFYLVFHRLYWDKWTTIIDTQKLKTWYNLNTKQLNLQRLLYLCQMHNIIICVYYTLYLKKLIFYYIW